MQLLTDDDWLRIARQPMIRNLETEDGLVWALSHVRQEGKMKFALRLGAAVSSYASDNGGQLPSDILQLKPYLDQQHPPPTLYHGGGFSPGSLDSRPQDYPPVEEGALQRYEMIQPGSINDLRPGQPVIAEVAPDDDQFDTLFRIGLKSYLLAGTGNNHANGWGGSEAPDLQSMTLEQRDAYEKSIRQIEESKQRARRPPGSGP